MLAAAEGIDGLCPCDRTLRGHVALSPQRGLQRATPCSAQHPAAKPRPCVTTQDASQHPVGRVQGRRSQPDGVAALQCGALQPVLPEPAGVFGYRQRDGRHPRCGHSRCGQCRRISAAALLRFHAASSWWLQRLRCRWPPRHRRCGHRRACAAGEPAGHVCHSLSSSRCSCGRCHPVQVTSRCSCASGDLCGKLRPNAAREVGSGLASKCWYTHEQPRGMRCGLMAPSGQMLCMQGSLRIPGPVSRRCASAQDALLPGPCESSPGLGYSERRVGARTPLRAGSSAGSRAARGPLLLAFKARLRRLFTGRGRSALDRPTT